MILLPGSPEWVRRVSASKVPAIVGLSRYQSAFGLWHEMRGLEPEPFPEAISERGHALEAGCKAHFLQLYPTATVIDQPQFELGDWAVATPDGIANVGGERFVVEYKTSQYMDDWGAAGSGDVPMDYAVQVMWQLHLSNLKQARVIVLFGMPFEFREYVIDYDPEIGVALEEAAIAFHESLTHDTPPALSDHVADYSALKRLHPEIDGTTVTTTHDLATEFIDATAALKAATETATNAKARLLHAMGNAKYAATNGINYARRQPNKNGVSLVEVRGAANKLKEPA